MDKKIVGMNLKLARKKKKLKQKELAEMIGYTESSISKYEQGLIEIPNSVIDLLAKVLEISPADLLGESWETEYNSDGKISEEVKTIELVKKYFGEKSLELLQQFHELNEPGKEKVLDYASDLALIPKYRKEK